MPIHPLDAAREVFDIEIEGLKAIRDNLGEGFLSLVHAASETLDKGGKLVLCGVGKSGHIAQKLSSTLASTGSPAVFMHPVEAMHGDLGMLHSADLLVAVSYSGETEELLAVLAPARRFSVRVAAITGFPESKLARWSDIVVPMPVPREACPFNLAPTTSTTALLALGDALAIALLRLRGFTKEDYGRLHPGGAIGRAVTLRAADVMRPPERMAIVRPSATVKDTLMAMTGARTGSAVVADEEGRLLGIFTDGDFRRRAGGGMDILARPVGDFMTPRPATLRSDQMAVDILRLIEARHVDDVVVVDGDGRVAGIVDVQDLPGLKLL